MYQDPTEQIGVTFNNTLAFLVASQKLPDMTRFDQGEIQRPAPTASSGSDNSANNSANIGAIASGVVGGTIILTAVVIFAWWFLRTRQGARSSRAPSKQYITKWSKEVPVRQAPSRWGGTSHRSDGVMGDPAKNRDMMMSPASTLPARYPHTPDGHKSSPFDGQRQSTTRSLVRDLAS
ncbi:hypothetical protein FS837_005966 [Tulasnella sp. UAMH 9824]|nr:hypothetical protein FS837_005966 [Tulasnella sp. UAMH 9824]